jgi:uncharacterized protein
VLIGLISDTHSYLPDEVFIHFKDVDEIWHAGDFGNVELIDKLKAFKPLRGVYGNIDGAEIRKEFKEDLIFTINDVKIYMTHIGGYPPRYNARSIEIIKKHKPHLFISGHSHIVKVMPDTVNHLLHINPGAAGKQGWHKVKTIMRFRIDNGKIGKLELIELDEKK